jgi:hypothetical protein
MEKKTYLIPAITVVALTQKTGILLTGSDNEGNSFLGNGGGTFGTSIRKGDTKYEDDYDLWDEE